MDICAEKSHSGSKESCKKQLRKLYIAISLCAVFMAVEIVGGYLANSLAIMSDAVHLLSDVAGFFTSIVAILISRRSATFNYTYGFQRAQTIGAMASIVFVWWITIYLVFEAADRIKNPANIDAKLMFYVALFGLAVNIVLAFSLGHDHGHSDSNHSIDHKHEFGKENLNIRAAFIHVLGDLIQSIGVLIASVIIWVKPQWKLADPICTIIFSIIVVISTIFISRDIVKILMEGTPTHIDIRTVNNDLMQIEGVTNVHDLHIWTLASNHIALTAHLNFNSEDSQIDREKILAQSQGMLCSKYKIHHSTIQIEAQRYPHCYPDFCAQKTI